MYPSNTYYTSNSDNNDNLIPSSYTLDQNLLNKPSIYEINSNSKQEVLHPHSLYYNVLSAYSNYEHNEPFVQHMYNPYLQRKNHIIEANASDPITNQVVGHSHTIREILEECKSKENESVVIEGTPRKKPPKKDRHSKIETAQGPRDRRMRLSLQVARDFFDLQDTLGFNKASKTVEWLLSKSEAAIKDLARSTANTASSTSEGEVVSEEKSKHLLFPSKDAKGRRGPTRRSLFNPLSKETREKARERARERTIEKRKKDGLGSCLEIGMSHRISQSGSWCKDDNNGYGVGELSSPLLFNYDMQNNGVHQEHQFKDSSLYAKPWDYSLNNTDLR